MPEPVLSIKNLVVEFRTEDGVVHAVDDISYDVMPGETLGIVGESGSGKSVSTMSILGLIPQPPGRLSSGSAMFKGKDLLPVELDGAFEDPVPAVDEAHHRQAGDALARAGLADDAEDLPLVQGERHAGHGLDHTVVRPESSMEVVDLEQSHQVSSILGSRKA